MSKSSEPPRQYTEFTARFPKLGEAWQLIRDAGEAGPLDAKTARLVKLAIAIGAMREGAVHASVRKALSAGIEPAAIEQVAALAAATMGLPSTVAVYSWTRDILDKV